MALYEETKQLQEERNQEFPGIGNIPVITPLQQALAAIPNRIQYNPAISFDIEPVPITSQPKSYERRLGSFYDPTLAQENFLAQQQSGLERMAYIIPRIATKAVSEVAQMPGYLGGAIAWGLHGFKQEDIGMAVNNWWQRGIQSLEEGVKDHLPIYTSDVIKSGNIWDNIFSTAFWANEGADGAGFLLAYLAPGAALRFLGAGAKVAKLIKPGTTVYKDLIAGAKAEEIAAALAGQKFAGNVNDVISTVVNTLFESSAEAGQSFNSVLEKTNDRNKAATAAVDVMTKNFGILGLSNYIDQKWLFGNSKLIREYAEKGLAKELPRSSMFRRVLGESGAPLDAVTQRTTWNQIGNLSKTVTKGFLKEGFYEEGSQYVAQKRAEAGTSNDEGFLNELVDFGKEYVDSMTDLDFQKSVLLGGLMGSVMSGVSTVRDIKAEDKMLGNFHDLIKNNHVDWTTGYSDLIQKDGEGNPITDEDGKYVLDNSKGKEFLAKKFTSYLRNKQMIDFAKTGNVEAFEAARNEKIFEQFIPFLQVEGGLQAAYTYINNLAETDVKYMQAEGIITKDVNETKQELRDKVTKFQQIYDRVNDTHELNLNTKYAKEDKAIYNDWSDKVKENKIGDEVFMQFAGERISDLRSQLAAFQMSDSNVATITSDETKISPKIVEDLKKTLNTFKPSIMTQTDISNTENIIQNIEGYVQSFVEAREDLANLYNKKSLQESYKTFKEYRTQSSTKSTEDAVSTAKKTETVGLTPELLDLYNKAVKWESVGDDIVRRAGEVSTAFTMPDGTLVGLSGEVSGKNDTGGLTVNVTRAEYTDNTGRLASGVLGEVASINPDGTVTYNGAVYTPTIAPGVTRPPVLTTYDTGQGDVVPDDEVGKAHDEASKRNQADYDKEAKHVFNINKGVSNWLFSTGNQRQVVNNDALGRWYLFVNKLADTRLSTGEHKYYVKTYTLSQIGQLPQNDIIRQLVTFYTGEINPKTYDNITDKDNAEANNDIKVVVFDRETNLPLRVGINGEITTEDKSQIVFNSLPMPRLETAEMKDRLSTNRIESDYLSNELGVPINREATLEEKDAAKKYADLQVEQSRVAYENFRNTLKSESAILNIDTINPGIKQNEGAIEQDILTATGIPNINLLASRIHVEAIKPGTEAFGWNSTRIVSGTPFRIRNGYWYVENVDNRLEVIRPKTLGDTDSVDSMIKVMQEYASNPAGRADIEQFLRNVLYMGITDRFGNPSPYRIFFTYKRDTNNKPIKGSLDKLVFGDNEIAIDDFIKGNEVDKLRSFLSTKFWNFNNKLKDTKEFTEFTTNKEGNIIQNTWEAADGGYIGFLFSSANNNPVKGTVLMKPQEVQGLKSVLYENANYVNQSINFIQPGSRVEPSVAPNNKITEIPKTKKLSEALAGKEVKQPTTARKLTDVLGTPAPTNLITTPTTTPTTVISYEEFLNTLWKDSNEIRDTFAKEGPEAAYTMYLTANKPNNLDRVATTYDNYERENLDLAKTWLKEKFPNISMEIFNEVKPGYTRLYRAETKIVDIIPGWLKNQPEFKDIQDATGRWFYKTLQEASDHINKFEPEGYISYVDVKTKDVEKYNAKSNKFVGGYGKLGNEYFIPKDIAINKKPVQELLIDNKSWGRLTKSSLILLSSMAEVGTAYHEGFHTFSQLVLANQVRKELYDEVRNRLNNAELTDRQAEEILAEEFREYMLYPNSYTFGKTESKKKNFFEKILDIILKIFHINKTSNKDFRIEMTFDILKNGSFGVVAKDLKSDFDRNRIAKLSPKETLIMLKDINYVFFNNVLFNPDANYTESSLFNLENTLDTLYGAVKGYYMFSKKSELRDKILENFADLRKEHIRFIRQYKIDVRGIARHEEIDTPEDEVEDKSSSYKDYLQVNMSDLAKDPVRLLIASLTTDDGRVVGTLSGYQARSTVRFNKTMSFLNNSLTGLGADFTNYVRKLEELSRFRPEMKLLLERLGSYKKTPTRNMVLLQNAFVNSFSHNKSKPNIFRYDFDGRKYFFNPVEDSNNRVLRRRWMNNARKLLNVEDSYIMRSGAGGRGKFIINTTTLSKDIDEARKLDPGSRNRTVAYLDILGKLGIVISPNYDDIHNYEVLDNYIKYLSQEISARKKTELSIQDLYNADVIQNQVEVNALVEYAKKFTTNDDDLSYYNQDGNREYSIGLNSHNSNVINGLNRITINPLTGEFIIPEEVQYLMPENSIFNKHSKWIAYRRSGGNLDYVLLKGVTTPNPKLGAEISRAFFGDYKSLEFNAILNGIFPNLRASDRKTEYALYPGKPNYSISRGMYKADMLNYMRDELTTSFALLIDPENWGGNLENYSNNARTLRVFNFIYDKELNSNEAFIPSSLEDFTKRVAPDDVRDTITKADDLTEQFIDEYSGYIDRSFDRFIDKDVYFNEQSLLEDKAIIEDLSLTGKSIGFKTPGLDPGVIIDEDRFNIKRDYENRISRNDLNRILLFHSYMQFIGANEQLRLFMGDLAFWKDPIEFHKRITGTTSPKQTLADGEVLRSNLESLFRRIDGKNKRTPTISVLVVPDVIVKNEALSTISPKYDKINSTDAASATTLDEHRDIKIREGDWPPHLEKTYQYEMQKLVIRLLELKKTEPDLPFMNKVSSDLFTDPSGIFYEHTKGKLPTTPMWEGRELKVKELGVISMMKPQGFGNIEDVKGLNATQYLKTAIAPIFPSAIDNNNPFLDTLLSMLDKQQGLIAFRSSMKGTVSSTGTQELNYKDLGIQLDVAEEGKAENTVSTQQQRLLFENIFDRGKLIEKFSKTNLGNLHNEFVNIINEIVEIKRGYLINRFGLVLNESTGRYGLPNTKEARDRFSKELIEAFEHRLMPSNITDGIELALESNDRVFDLTPSKFKIEEVLMAEIRHIVISRKTAGDMLIQESPVLYNEGLKFYDGTDEGSMEVMVSLPYKLIDFTESIGGIDALNKAIADNDTKLLGKDFFKILNVPMNRIPGQSLSSLDVARIKKFLPHYHGSKVILPAEITVKANSDFDVDKMTSYLNNFDIDPETKKVRYYTDLNTLEGKQNRFNEIIRESLLQPDRFEELVTPLNADHIKKLAIWARGKTFDHRTPIEREVISVAGASDKGEFKWHNTLAFWYNMQVGRDFFKSKLSMATANIHNVAMARSQAIPVRQKAYVPLFFKGQHLSQGQEYNTGFMYDSDNVLVSKNFAGFVSAFVDSVKDKFVFEILSDEKVYNVIAYLNNHGIDSAVGLESIVGLITQDVVIDYLRLARSNQPRYLAMSEYGNKLKLNFEKQYGKTIVDLKKRLDGLDTNIPDTYSKTVTASFEKLLRIDKTLPPEDSPRYATEKEALDNEINKVLKEIADKINTYGYRDFSKEDLRGNDIRTNFKDQVQVLDNFLMYRVLGQELTGLNMFLRPDARSGMYRHISAVEASTGMLYNNLLKRGLFNQKDITEAVLGQPTGNPSLIAEYYKTKASTGDIFGWTSMIHKDPVIQGFFVDNVYSVFGNPERYVKKGILDRVYTNVESDFLTYIMSDMYNFKDYTKLQEEYKRLFTGEESVPRRLLALKGVVRGNEAIDELEPNISQRLSRSRTIAETDGITTYNRSLEPYTIDAIAGDLTSFATETTPENQNFVSDLMMHGVFQSGFHASANSYMHVLPPVLFVDLAKDAISRFISLDDETKMIKLNSFLEQMYRNNAYNTQIVPRGNYPIGNPTYWTDRSNFYKLYDYVSFNRYTANPRAYRNKKMTPPQEILLYKRVPGTNRFKKITKLGEGLNFKEFYPMLGIEELENVSIVESSNYKLRPLDVTFEEYNLAEVSETSVPEDANPGYEPDDLEQDGDIPEEYGEEFSKTFDSTMLEKGYTSYIGENESNYYYKILGKESTLQRALKLIEDKTSDKSASELAKVLRSALSRRVIPLQINRKFESESDEAMEYYADTGKTLIGGKYYYKRLLSRELKQYKEHIVIYEKLDDKGFEVTTIHEAIHALTQYEYDTNPDFKKKLDRIIDYTTKFLTTRQNEEVTEWVESNKEIFYDAGEFIAYAFSHSNFQQALARVPAENPILVKDKLKRLSVLTEFLNTIIDLVKKYFNKMWSTELPDYNKKVQNMVSVLHDLTALVEEELLPAEPASPVIREITERELMDVFRGREQNRAELSKESSTNFEDLYTEYDYLTQIEKDSFNDAVNKGSIQLACGL